MSEETGSWFGDEDVLLADRVKWLAAEQSAGRGTVVSCAMCGGSGDDPDDPFAKCPMCRRVGAVLRGRPRAAGLGLVRAAVDHMLDLDDQSKHLTAEMSQAMIGDLIQDGELKPLATYLARYCDVIGSQAEAEQLAEEITAVLA